LKSHDVATFPAARRQAAARPRHARGLPADAADDARVRGVALTPTTGCCWSATAIPAGISRRRGRTRRDCEHAARPRDGGGGLRRRRAAAAAARVFQKYQIPARPCWVYVVRRSGLRASASRTVNPGSAVLRARRAAARRHAGDAGAARRDPGRSAFVADVVSMLTPPDVRPDFKLTPETADDEEAILCLNDRVRAGPSPAPLPGAPTDAARPDAEFRRPVGRCWWARTR